MKKYAYTDEQMKVLRDYYFDEVSQWLIEGDTEEIFHSWESALELAYAVPGRWEWGYAVQCRGLVADSQYLYNWNNGIDVVGDEAPEPLPEYFTGTWPDPDIANAYNAHMPEMNKLWGIVSDICEEIDEEFTVGYYDMTEDERERYDEMNDYAYSAMYDFCEEHQKAIDDLCAAAEKLLNNTNNYYYSDEAADDVIYDYAEEWIAEGRVWFDEN